MSINLVVCGLKSSILPRNRPSWTVEVDNPLVLSFNIVPVMAKVLGKVMHHRSNFPLSWDEVVDFIFLIQFCILLLSSRDRPLSSSLGRTTREDGSLALEKRISTGPLPCTCGYLRVLSYTCAPETCRSREERP